MLPLTRFVGLAGFATIHKLIARRKEVREMAIDVVFEYDADKGIVFTIDEGTLGTQEEVDQFISLNRKYFEKLGHKVWVVSNIDGLKIRPPVANYYGESVRKLVEEWVLGHVRYGKSPPSRMTVRTSYLKARIDPNIYGTRQEAVKAIEKMRRPEES